MTQFLVTLSVFVSLFLYQGGQAYGQQPSAASSTASPATTTQQQPQPVVEKPIILIKQLSDNKELYSFELRDVELSDLFRMLAHDYKLNLLIDDNVKGKVNASFNAISLEDGLLAIANNNNLLIEKNGQVRIIKLNLVTRIFVLKYASASKLLASSAGTSASAATNSAAPVSSGAPDGSTAAMNSQANTSSSAVQKTTSTIFDLMSENGKMFLGDQPNSIMVIDYALNIKKIEEYLSAVDQKMSSKVFKLKYLKASSILGQSTTPAAASASSSSAAGSSPSGG